MPKEIKEILEKLNKIVYPVAYWQVEEIFKKIDSKIVSIEGYLFSFYYYGTKIYKIDNKLYKFRFLLDKNQNYDCLLISFLGEVNE